MADLLSADTHARQRALDPASFIVEAPAGAGKTELLTQRTLRLLALVDHPEEVVALTFTNKAATEMRDRILGSLELAATGNRPSDDLPHKQLTFDLGRAALARDTECGWQLLQHPGRLAVTTLDALCGSLARQMPLLSRFGAQPGIAEDAEEHCRSAARRTLALLEDGGPEADTVAAALDHVDNHHGRLEALLIQLLARRDQWLQHTARTDAELRAEAEAGLAALIQRDLDAAAAAISGRWQSEVMAAARFAANTLLAENADTPLAPLAEWSQTLGHTIDDLPRWQALAELVLTKEGTRRKALNKNNGLPATPDSKPHKAALQAAIDSLDDHAASALAALRGLPPARYDDATWGAVETFSHLLNLAAAQLWLVFQEAGVVDFGEIAQRALQALGSDEAPTDLALALDYRIRHLLVDEFQDTSPTQVRLIAGLTRGWSANDGRTLFLVGDPMQSIYRFRKADVGLFLKVREGGIGSVHPEKLRLTRNNRSLPAIVDWVNTEFPRIFPAQDDPLAGAVCYAPSVATKTGNDGGVQVHPQFTNDAEAEARQMLTVIRQTRAARPDDSIAVLVRARAHLNALVATIRRDAPELRFQAVETESLAGLQAVQDVLSLAHAMLHRGDRVHWLAILRAPWCGLTLADLHALAADDHQATIWSLLCQPERLARLSADGQRRLAPLIATLQQAFAHAGRQHPRRWIQSVWQQIGGPSCLTRPGDHDAITALWALI
ncbi:MAG TPA: UvrD-helicase domain-containing protein, partial [Rhodocyclaceae bacterium]|nr:UvrD-helicase domain-containing protein [Rhodocyclaceae bacterium]